MKVKQKIRQLGIGLLELMLSLAIIAVLLVMATRYYEVTQMSEKVNAAVGIIQAIRGASGQWAAGKKDYTGVNMDGLEQYGLLPRSIISGGSASNPWGGPVSVAPAAADPTKVTVTLDGLPSTACENIQGKFSVEAGTDAKCDGKTVTVTFG